MKLTYRADIDGLRALAVLSVILFHINIPGFPGGFVGVDIFFVISGFLITSIILKEIETNSFSISRFYERRVRRIFPALFPVIAATFAVGAYWLSPKSFKELGDSVVATTLFVSNLLFRHEAGYFDAPSLQKPLLHTWSLSVEEQFYLFYPLLLVLIKKFLKGKYVRWLFPILLISFALSIYAITYKPSIAFYWFPPRAWELLVGSLIALNAFPVPGNIVIRNLLALAGTAMMLGSIFFFSESVPFPGLAALLPVIGAGFVIYSGMNGDHVLKKFYESKPVVFIGLLSYSLYLWHWPFIVFTRYVIMRAMSIPETLLILGLIFTISYLSWRYIETPFRAKPSLIPQTSHLFALSALTMLVSIGIGTLIHLQEGFPARLGLSTEKNPEYIKETYTAPRLEKIQKEGESCLIGKTGQSPSFLVWGDSHAGSFTAGMSVIAQKYGKAGVVLTGPGIPPLLDVGSGGKNVNSETNAINNEVIGYLSRKAEIKTVFLVACWYYTSNTPWFSRSLRKTIDTLLSKNKHVVIITDVPFLTKDLQQAHAIAFRNSKSLVEVVGVSRKEYITSNKPLIDAVAGYAGNGKVSLLRLGDSLYGKDEKMILIRNKKLLYNDNNHLSIDGSIYAVGKLEKAIAFLLEQSE